MREFDAIIIGAGQAGPLLAGRLTGGGMTVAVVERKLFGGTWVNTGCVPRKTLVASAYAANLAPLARASPSVMPARPSGGSVSELIPTMLGEMRPAEYVTSSTLRGDRTPSSERRT